MDFNFSEEQRAFRESVVGALEREADRDYVRAMVADETGVTEQLWDTATELGWTALLVPGEHGGLGGGLVDAIILLEETGRLPLPGPLFSSAFLATLAARHLGAADLLEDLAAGETRGTVAIEERSAADPLQDLSTRAIRQDGGWQLYGTKSVVLDGHTADWAIVAARTGSEIGAFLVDDPPAEPVPGMDPTRKIAQLELDGTRARRLGEGDATWPLRRLIDDAAVGLAAELLGASDRALELAVDYSRDRVQFGRPIGSFQVIRHTAAEMLQQVELARVGVHYAAWTSDEEAADRARSAALAKSWSSETANAVTADCIQIHGAVGFTWEADPHLLYKRAKVNDLLFGQAGWQRQRVADDVIGHVPAAPVS